MINSIKTESPNVRFKLPDLTTATETTPFANQSRIIRLSTMLSPKMYHLTSVKPPLSNSIDKHTHAIHKAIKDGRLTQLKYFLEMGLSANCVDKQLNKRSGLMLACLNDQVEYGVKVARVLLKHGADLNAQDSYGRTVLYMAAHEDRIKLFEFLMNDENSLGVDLRQKDNDGNTLLNYVCMIGSPRMVEIVTKRMIERSVECDQRNNLGYTALLLAIKNDRFLNAMALIKSCPSVSVSIRDREKCMNAIEWLEHRIGANKEQLESDSDSQIRYCNESRRGSARTRLTAKTRQIPAQSSRRSPMNCSKMSSNETSRTNSSELTKSVVQELYKTIYMRMSKKLETIGPKYNDTRVNRSMLELETMRETPKLLRLSQPALSTESPPPSSKSMVHGLFEMYDDGSNRLKSRQKVAKVRVKKNSVANIVIRERGARGSIVSLSHRIRIHSDRE